MRTFFHLLATALVVVTANNFVWFAVVFWAFLTTKSVISTSTMGGLYLVMMAASGIWFGAIVDRHKKKHVMLGSSLASVLAFGAGLVFLYVVPADAFSSVASPWLWILVTILLTGTIAGTVYNIAVPTLVGLTVPEEQRDRANGMFGTVIGTGFAINSVASGVALAYLGMEGVLGIAIAATLVALVLLGLARIDERDSSAEPRAVPVADPLRAPSRGHEGNEDEVGDGADHERRQRRGRLLDTVRETQGAAEALRRNDLLKDCLLDRLDEREQQRPD